MPWIAGWGIAAVWIAFFAYWWLNARDVKPATRTESPWIRFGVYGLPLLIAIGLLGPERWFGGWLGERFVTPTDLVLAVALMLAVAGIALAIWARRILGPNWSGVVQLKQDHELIEAGPYRWIRHPIYTGLLLAFLGTALRTGEWRGLLAVLIVGLSFWRKLRLEERWLIEHFGERYEAYRKRSKALIPFVL